MAENATVPGSLFDPGTMSSMNQFAERYTKNAMDSGADFLGKKGLLESSFLPAMMEDAYQGGMQQAQQAAYSEQSRQDEWSMFLTELQLQEDMMDSASQRQGDGMDWLMPTLSGASVGGAIPGAGLWGAGIGAGLGYLASQQ
jgi:hypothetical protein